MGKVNMRLRWLWCGAADSDGLGVWHIMIIKESNHGTDFQHGGNTNSRSNPLRIDMVICM